MNPNNQPEYPIGERIKYFRMQKGYSTNKLANESGISQSYLRDIELQNKNPTVEIIYLICKTLGITLKQFFDDDTSDSISNDPLIQKIYQLSPEQRESLLAFLKTIMQKKPLMTHTVIRGFVISTGKYLDTQILPYGYPTSYFLLHHIPTLEACRTHSQKIFLETNLNLLSESIHQRL